ncbi:MAG: ATP-dependent zinc metalloprotease FtsH [Meiothermus sp.]|uniref:ATP-dependent zinc metalloprotease FtsH n=1 Tax=Meiothermus sp. TaxID=1955249 RepID=UPI0025DD31AC|nr:ATP-dependent zinc metalloprotease FtsH [Meiothermus sp.]MCS7057735.1 ATP-dependent zinc metalloprotease FtsH [Meiothermus sp.]MCS7194462.1 ATP-dependent zinc metalloprotease FtsH [Meiothermus sp.]MDW8482335.1 ATP-dependent zinc metalloprotease FtsH [Meiothermus sp.]
MNRLPFNLWFILLAAILIAWAFSLTSHQQPSNTIAYTVFLNEIEQGRVARIVVDGRQLTVSPKDGSEPYITFAPSPVDTATIREWGERKVQVEVAPPRRENPLLGFLIPLLLVGLLVAAFFFLSRNRSPSGDNAFSFTKSRARVLTEAPKTSFKDVAGCEEAKEELKEIVEFLKSPGRFHEMGARIPKGVLLVGPPGSGKTHIARAVAGEAKVPFIAASGSDFVEMFVGVGAARVRDLFETAKRHAPCIIFIDEIDAVGRRRGGGIGGGNDEREQTLNQLLVEMDGFEKESSVIVMAATNRPDVLDPALLRPGRFDRQVAIDAPDVRGREQILRIHAKGKPLAEDVDLALLAKRTPGFVGADLENLLNEAALLAAREGRKKITMKDLEEAADRVVMGPARKSMVVTPKDREITAYHEAGHALAAHFLEHADKVHKVTIIPRGRAMGFMMPSRQDTLHWSKKRLTDQIAVALAGRVAEELVFDDVTTGAENDFRQATDLARRMITEWGMHPEFGMVAYQVREDTYLGGYDTRQYSEDTARRIDEAVQRFLQEQYERVKQLLTEKREVLERVTRALLEQETLTGEEFVRVVQGEALENPSNGQPREKEEKEPPRVVPKVKPNLGGA